MQASVIEIALRSDRRIVVAGLVLVTASAWLYTLAGIGMHMSSDGIAGMAEGMRSMMTAAHWSPSYAALVFLMWWIMMVAMMVPSAAPTILLFAAIHRRKHRHDRPYVPTGLLMAGYLAVWGLFSLVATLLQWRLELTGLVSSEMMTAGMALASVILLAAGLYQLTPLKRACLRHCRSPVAFVTAHWRTGAAGAFRMGVVHGAFCVGCCWVLMGLLFIGGVMNPFWIGGVALYILLEKLVPHGHWLRRVSGVVLAGSGILMLAQTG